MKLLQVICALLSAVVVVLMCVATVPIVFAERVIPGVHIGDWQLVGIPSHDLPGVLAQYEKYLQAQKVLLSVHDRVVTRSLGELGVSLDMEATLAQAQTQNWAGVLSGRSELVPVLQIDRHKIHFVAEEAFGDLISLPRNASLILTPTTLVEIVKSEVGEGIDLITFEQDVLTRARRGTWQHPIELVVVSSPPEVLDSEVTQAKAYAEELLRNGLTLFFHEQSFDVKPFTLRRLIQFLPVPEVTASPNYHLGVVLDEAGLQEFLTTTIAPEINREATNARFERSDDGRVNQFGVAGMGQELDIQATTVHIAAQVAQRQTRAQLHVKETEPSVTTQEDIEALGITTLLASGESNFSGSPNNRIHNIKVGTERYHGLLIPPEAEFSFNEHLGPVDGAHGFKPELVIKHNVTTPELGGGLCQVSTTAFRAALYSGLKVTARRNHAYAVRYYGTPGFDATIYPPYTDLRFINNTPGYILIQARVEGTTLTFDFWGTADGRTVHVDGPVTYDRQPDGAVKATLTQRVEKEDAVMIDDTFYSRYRSPNLFPKVAHANDPKAPTATPVPPQPTPTPTHAPTKPTPRPASTPTPAR